jgi:radical SAM protein with 4Fe4S-binding SPASM domain
MKGNLHDIIPLAKWVESLDNVAYNIQAIVEPFQKPHIEQWYNHPDYADLWPTDREKIKEVIESLIDMKKKKFKERMNNTVTQLSLFKDYFFKPEGFIKHNGCSLVDTDTITINPDGSVYICPFMDPVGNIKLTKLKSILDSQDSDKTISMMKVCTKNCHHLMNCYYKDEEVESI